MINLRLNIEVKNKLEELAERQQITLSDCLRRIINKHLGESNEVRICTGDYFENSFEFSQMIVWILTQYIYPNTLLGPSILGRVKLSLERAINETTFNNEFKIELQKVLNEVKRVLNDHSSIRKELFFMNYNLDESVCSFDIIRNVINPG